MRQFLMYSALLIAIGAGTGNLLLQETATCRVGVKEASRLTSHEIDTLQAGIRLHPATSYGASRAAIAKAQLAFRSQYKQAKTNEQQQKVLDSAGKFLTDAIVNQLVPHWYGTPWSFEGYTEVPRKGTIACGYLVSTVLMHAGLNINRYKMAQQDPWCEVQTLHQKTLPITFPCNQQQDFADSVRTSLRDGLYILGMINHVGLLLKRRGDAYLIHSSYLLISQGKAEVTIERIADTRVVMDGSECLIGEITTNSVLMRQWLLAEPVSIVMR